ncbi:MAG: type II toxin-antitoxin system VapC family toxin [Gammaproteobacteria bacterium]
MIPVKVIDASALAAITFGEPTADAVAIALEEGRLVAPPLIRYEMASICCKKLKLYPEQRKGILAAYQDTYRFGIELIEVDFQALIIIAEQARITVYDAAYLWLAKALSAELITLDNQLIRACKAVRQQF